MKNKTNKDTHYPWRDNNQVDLLYDGDVFFPAMLDAIDRARHRVLLEMYLMESGTVAQRFIDALCRCASRGVEVYLLLDGFGVLGLSLHDRQQLEKCGVHLGFFNPLAYGKWRQNLSRDHRKLLCVDGETAFTGGAGITDEFDPPDDPASRWHETMVQIRGPVVMDWQHSFTELWNQWALPKLEPPPQDPPTSNGHMRCRVSLTEARRHQDVKRGLINHLRASRQRIWIASAYFIPTWKTRRMLKKAARHGVDVRLLLPGERTDHPSIRHIGRRYYHRLLRNGVRIFEYQPAFLHAKVMLCDDWVSIGSTNLDRWTQHWNLEANLEVKDSDFSSRVGQMFLQDFSHSREYLYDEWQRRPWHRRLLESFWGMVNIWVEYLARLRRFRVPLPWWKRRR